MVTNVDETAGAVGSPSGGGELTFAPEADAEATVTTEAVDTTEAPEAPPVAEQPVPEPVQSSAATSFSDVPQAPAPAAPPRQDYEALQAKAAQYEQVRMQQAIQQQASQYQQQLVSQGYDPQQAQQAAQAYMQTQAVQADLVRKAEEYGQHIQGRQAYAEQMAVKYNLNLADLPNLRNATSPQDMEAKAREMSGRRKEQGELARLRQAQVPAQQFDNSQGTPTVPSNEGSALDAYNAGDRSARAVQAARKAAGLS